MMPALSTGTSMGPTSRSTVSTTSAPSGLDYAETAEPAYRLIMSGGLGNDVEVQSFVADQRARYRHHSPVCCFRAGPSHRNISRAALHTLIMAMAPGVLTAAVAADPLMPGYGSTERV